MGVVNRIIETEQDRKSLLKFIEGRPIPFTVSITSGKHRSSHQNRLQRQWMLEIAAQLGDRTPEEVRGECKLMFGVPILRAENEAFRAVYDEIVKPQSYENKVKMMMEPLDLPVTRIMNTKQKTAYLDAIHRHYSGMGFVLTNPEDLKFNQSGTAMPVEAGSGVSRPRSAAGL